MKAAKFSNTIFSKIVVNCSIKWKRNVILIKRSASYSNLP